MSKKLITFPFEKLSGIKLPGNALKIIKQHSFIPLINTSVGGDAPKDVIRMYIYDGKIRKESKKTWPTYIAKVGHKWYPNESITEQLISCIGKTIGIKIAQSELVVIEDIVRFCSRHFHSRDQSLNHGAEILSIYLDEVNEDWIEELDRKNEIKEFINVTDIIKALEARFPENIKDIIFDFVNMILFDGLIGNNDRHYYNWGVITHIEGKHLPYFAPIFDSARGLWWNHPDIFVLSLHGNNDLKQSSLHKYVYKSVPKISVPKNNKCNHFELIEYLKDNNYISPQHVKIWKDEEILLNICELVDKNFSKLMIRERRELIKETLKTRFEAIKNII